MEQVKLNNQITILVNSCDSYSDLWPAFFTLLKRYWNIEGIRVLLNTETKDYSDDDINLECIHCPNAPYGARIRHALREVRTEYVICMLDDFFLRSPVDNRKVNQLVDWMEADKRNVCFRFDPLKTEYDLDCPYEGFFQICPGTNYILSLQLGLWRTEKFLSYWTNNITPWEWEVLTNIKTCWHKNDQFFRSAMSLVFDYGYNQFGGWMGVQRGKWVLEDVVPLFEKEGIIVDFEARNNTPSVQTATPALPCPKSFVFRQINKYKEVKRLLGIEGVFHRFVFDFERLFSKLLGIEIENDFYVFTRKKAIAGYLRTHGKRERRED